MANPISLAAYRHRLITQRALAALDAAKQREAPRPVQPTYIAAEPGKVLLRFSDGAELELSPEHCRTWAERLAGMADVAEALAREGGDAS